MATASSQSTTQNVDASDTNLYPTQRHAGKVGYGPNFGAGGGIVDKLTGLAYEVKGKITHDPALVHHGHEVFTGEAKRKKILGTEDEDPVFSSGQYSGKKQPEKTQGPPPSGTASSPAERRDIPKSSAPDNKSGKKKAPESPTSRIHGHVIDKPAVEHLERN